MMNEIQVQVQNLFLPWQFIAHVIIDLQIAPIVKCAQHFKIKPT